MKKIKLKKLFLYIKINGLYDFLCLTINILYNNLFIRPKFAKAGKILTKYPRYIKGYQNIELGDNFSAGVGLRLEAVLHLNGKRYNPKIKIGKNVILNDYVHIGATNLIHIGDNVLIGSKVLITDHNHGDYHSKLQSSPFEIPSNRELTNNQEVIIEDNTWIGENVCILPGVKIGYGSVIGAGSVVNKNIPPFSIAAGNPAKVIKQFSQESGKWIKF